MIMYLELFLLLQHEFFVKSRYENRLFDIFTYYMDFVYYTKKILICLYICL